MPQWLERDNPNVRTPQSPYVLTAQKIPTIIFLCVRYELATSSPTFQRRAAPIQGSEG